MAKKPPKQRAPWDARSVPGTAQPKSSPPRPGDSTQVEVSSDVGIPRVPAGARPEQTEAPDPPLREESTKADEEASFWGIGTKAAAPVPVQPGDELLSGDEELFDPATGWNYSAVGGRPAAAPDDIATHPALSAISLAGIAAVSRSKLGAVAGPPAAPPLGTGLPPANTAERALTPDTADLPHLPVFKTSGRWAKPPAAPQAPIYAHPGRNAEPMAPSDDAMVGSAEGVGMVGRGAGGDMFGDDEQAAFDEPDEPTEGTVKVEFDDDGFFSIADVPAPIVREESFFVEEESVYEISPIEDSVADTSSPVLRVESTGEFEFHIEATPELGDEIFSGAAIPSLPPELTTLSVEDSIKKAQQLFQEGEADMGMALLEDSLLASPEDHRLVTWLEYGERRLISAYCPVGRPERVPILRQSREQLLTVTAGNQRDLVSVIDGRTAVRDLRKKLPHVPVVAFWKELGKLTQRGWLGWAD